MAMLVEAVPAIASLARKRYWTVVTTATLALGALLAAATAFASQM